MGTLLGHIVPGTFFALFAIWWGFCIAIRYYYTYHTTKNVQKTKKYYSTTTFPCLCFPSSRKIPIESYLKIFCAVVGILGESITGFTYLYDENLKRKIWGFGENNAQHITMFFGFALASVFEVLVHFKYPLPNGIDFLANIVAFVLEGFLFHFHLHGRNEIDVHVHTLLVYSIIFCVIATIWEYSRPNEILATYARIAGTLLQGLWFYAVGFILYFPSSDPYWIWLPSHGSLLLLTTMFVWFALVSMIILFLQSLFIWSILKRKHSHNYDGVSDEQMVGYSSICLSDNEDEQNETQMNFQ